MQSRLFRTVCTSLRVFAFGVLVVGAVGCGESSRDSLLSPLPFQNPLPTSQDFDLTGVWSGTLSQEGSDPIPVTWTASQVGDSVAGPLTGLPETGDFGAILAGVITNAEPATMTLTLTVGEQSLATGPACAAFGSGQTGFTHSEISADIEIVYVSDCFGFGSSEVETETFRLSLSRE